MKKRERVRKREREIERERERERTMPFQLSEAKPISGIKCGTMLQSTPLSLAELVTLKRLN